MTYRTPLVLCILVTLSACGPSPDDNNNSDGDAHVFNLDAQSNNNSNQNTNWQPPTNSRIYVNTQDTLYYVDPGVSEDLVEIGDFSGPCTGGSGFYDIAVNEARELLGIAAEGLYHVDKDTAQCSYAFQFPEQTPHFFSLSYVKGVDLDEPSLDMLIAATAEQGDWVQINYPADVGEIFIYLGHYDFPDLQWLPSGDIISIQVDWTQYVCYATLECAEPTDPGCESDWLAEIDPPTGNALLIGATGFQRIFGLGFWGDRVYGFTAGGDYFTIDVDTGAGTLVQSFPDLVFWGAGNTTIPHVVR